MWRKTSELSYVQDVKYEMKEKRNIEKANGKLVQKFEPAGKLVQPAEKLVQYEI